MRMLLATLGSRGDVEPFVWLARAAQDAGHQVRVALPVSGDVDTRGVDAVGLGSVSPTSPRHWAVTLAPRCGRIGSGSGPR